MSGLPPTGPNNKVSIRSKSSSIKRPISMDISENKKEGKGLFSKLKKGSSNSRLDEESQYRETSPRVNFIHNNNNNNNKITPNNSLPVDRVQGRNFDSDDEDYEIYPDETSVTKMEKLFDNADKVIRNPALVGSLLKYLILHNLDYYGLLYYLVVQHYKMMMQNKELAKDALRYINEIFTTFLHDKSVLRIEHRHLKSIFMDDLKNVKDLSIVFDDSVNTVFKNCIVESVKKVKTSIAHGLFEVESNVEVMSFEEKMVCFNNAIKFIVKTLDKKLPENNQNPTKESKEQEQYLSDVILGVKSSLATIYFYFTKKDKEENSDNLSMVSSKFSSLIGKSLENLPMMTNCFLDKQPIFCSKIHKRQSSHSFFKKGKALKGHNFQEKLFEYPAECILCEKLIWGIAPQGFLCSHCQGASHKGCKDSVRITCQKDSRKYNRHSYNLNPQTDDDTSKSSIAEENVSNGSTGYDNVDSKVFPEKLENNENESKNNSVEKEHVSDDAMQISISSMASDVSQNAKQNYVTSTATIIVTNNDEKPPENTYETESTDNVSDIILFDSAKSDADKSDPHPQEKSHVKTMAHKYDQKSIPRSQSLRKVFDKFSDSTMETSTLPRIAKRPSDSVHVQELIQEPILWNNDSDMEVGETFEADKELRFFPKHKNKESDKAEYTRLLVLMEFHHKTKFTVMTLKRFDYLLIKSWPSDETLIFNTLSLNCIKPLYELIKKLADTIESCRNEETFTPDTAKKVSEWLINDDESNLQEWLKYSIDLCCTNSLMLVKNTWKEARKNDHRLYKILDRRYNKMIMVEQLSNMRPLLFNFPLIVNKLFKDLSKFQKFKEEAKLWKSIHEKFKLLPTFIDEHCMPLVQLINNGVIINGSDRNGWAAKLFPQEPYYNFILDFPKTAFHYKLFDFQEIKISKYSESGRKIKAAADFVKEPIDAIAICYENMLVLLQKENDKYVLKQFKAAEANKCTPILEVDNVHTSKGEKKGSFFELAMVFINVAVLIQLLFPKLDVMEKWHDFIYKIKMKMMKNIGKFTNNINTNINIEKHNDNDSMEFNPSMHEFDSTVDSKDEISEQFIHFNSNIDDSSEILKNKIQSDEVVSKFENMKESIEEYISCINLMKLESEHEATVFPTPSDSYEFLIGTTYDAGTILKLCNDNCSMGSLKRLSLNSISDEIIDQLLINISLMKNRIENYKNFREKDTLSINEIDYIISEKQERSIQSIDGSRPESEELDETPFHMDNPDQSSIEVEGEESELQPENYDENDSLTSFVNKYVDDIIAAAQSEISQSNESSNHSDDHLSSQDNLFVDQISN